MKNIFRVALGMCLLAMVSCKKDYSCKATYGSEEKIFNCENCSSSDVDAYETKIKGSGWTDVNCEKK